MPIANNIIDFVKSTNGGFITDENLDDIILFNRLQPILVRCGNGRFTAPAQDIRHFVDIITKEGSDYIRDLSLPAGR
jgi:hypothetical protein